MEQAVEIGYERHKELFCRVFLDTHEPYTLLASPGLSFGP
jgi:hypothetical protein